MNERIRQLRKEVESAHACKARHERSTPITEGAAGQTIVEDMVESFSLKGHQEATRCYAWSYEQGGEIYYTTLLELPPVDSPYKAVQIALAAQARQ
jgi:hypothetical protein